MPSSLAELKYPDREPMYNFCINEVKQGFGHNESCEVMCRRIEHDTAATPQQVTDAAALRTAIESALAALTYP